MLRARRLCGLAHCGVLGLTSLMPAEVPNPGLSFHIRTLFSRQGAKIMYKTALRASEGTWYLREGAELPFPGSP
jgi:hypothetical protein